MPSAAHATAVVQRWAMPTPPRQRSRAGFGKGGLVVFGKPGDLELARFLAVVFWLRALRPRFPMLLTLLGACGWQVRMGAATGEGAGEAAEGKIMN